MPQAKFSKKFDYLAKRGGGMTSYPSGFEGDIPQAHFDAAAAAGALDGVAKPTEGKDSGGPKAGGTK